MTVYTLSPNLPEDSFVDWMQTSLWAQGQPPEDPSAQVYFNDTGRDYFIEIGQGEQVSIGSFSIESNHLVLDGSLASAGSVSVSAGAGIQIYGGTLDAQSLHLNGTPGTDLGLVGVGTVTVAGPVYNDSTIIAGNATGQSDLNSLTLNAAYVDNLGLLEASVGTTFTVTVTLAAGFANYAYQTLSGGTYEAISGGTLDLKTNGTIVNDSATLILDGAGIDTIAAYNPASGQYVPIQSTLAQVTSAGTLELDAASYSMVGTLTVQGVLKLIGAADVSAGTLYLTSSGQADLSDAFPGESMTLSASQILNNGQISVDGVGGGVATLSGPVSGSGSIVLGPAVTTINQFGAPVTTTANVELTGADSNSLTFSDGTGSFILDTPAAVSGIVQHFTSGDTIVLSHVTLASVTSYAYANGVLTLTEGSTGLHLDFSGSYTTQDFALSTDSATGGVAITGTSLIGVAPATHTG
jgi:hypothetical protein